MRVGVAGPPGAGKSTLIDKLGLEIVKHGYKVGVLAVDPSSHLSGGSLLGDKTRMCDLCQVEEVFIRASPTKCILGGVGPATADSIKLCEWAGYDVVVVESVGVGQNETFIDSIVDMVVLVLQPTSGDALQTAKKGIMEIADAVVINKADGSLKTHADKLQLQIQHNLCPAKY
mmetsp:Transcript_15979/g.7658  ORF Transcript_15979/g.7658 Transcript_15979/m.7658 type:complete len:173 (-) Transcript_15979:329-847(-)